MSNTVHLIDSDGDVWIEIEPDRFSVVTVGAKHFPVMNDRNTCTLNVLLGSLAPEEHWEGPYPPITDYGGMNGLRLDQFDEPLPPRPPSLVEEIQSLPEQRASRSRDFGRGYSAAIKDVLDLLRRRGLIR